MIASLITPSYTTSGCMDHTTLTMYTSHFRYIVYIIVPLYCIHMYHTTLTMYTSHFRYISSIALYTSIYDCISRTTVTGWRRLIGSLIFIGHFPQNWHIFSGSFVENDLQLRGSSESSPLCTCTTSGCMYHTTLTMYTSHFCYISSIVLYSWIYDCIYHITVTCTSSGSWLSAAEPKCQPRKKVPKSLLVVLRCRFTKYSRPRGGSTWYTYACVSMPTDRDRDGDRDRHTRARTHTHVHAPFRWDNRGILRANLTHRMHIHIHVRMYEIQEHTTSIYVYTLSSTSVYILYSTYEYMSIKHTYKHFWEYVKYKSDSRYVYRYMKHTYKYFREYMKYKSTQRRYTYIHFLLSTYIYCIPHTFIDL